MFGLHNQVAVVLQLIQSLLKVLLFKVIKEQVLQKVNRLYFMVTQQQTHQQDYIETLVMQASVYQLRQQ